MDKVLLIGNFPFPGRRGGPGTGPELLRSGESGFLLAGILGTGVPSSGDPEAGVLSGYLALYVICSLPESERVSSSCSTFALYGICSLPEGMDAGFGAGASRNRNLEASVLPEAWMIFPNQCAPYFSISSSNSGNNLCTKVNRSCSFSAGFPWDPGCIPLDVKTYSWGSLIDYGFDTFSTIVYSVLEIFGASTQDDHRARPSVDIGEDYWSDVLPEGSLLRMSNSG
ncbi:hypothetical protein DY000_02020572 [Brassica cretica]|uniref:Xylanase inhibitor N-terminal domain-containing protein n=1 Tax=Brassica cretica TaxID=69181 RepID=A0ABQ7END1_BRACR|nr:hypothetical protein DY000_02020572 [Brassica cretica]